VDEKVDATPPKTVPSTCVGVPHPYTVLEGIEPVEGVTAKVEPVHRGPILILDIDGVGFTYTVAENTAPEHSNPPLLYIGVTL
jgi:hypothetical protein